MRDLGKAPVLVASAVEVFEGDLTDPVTLQRACSGASHVLAAAHGLLGRGRQRSERVDDAGHRALIAAARSAGVERFVYTSAYGAAPDHPIEFFRTKWAIEQVLAASGLDHVILRPTAFMEHHAHNFNGAGLLAKGKAQLIGRGTKLRNFIAATDVATLAVRALLEVPPPFRRLDMGGPGNYSNLDVTALYAKTAGIEARSSHLPSAVARFLSVVAAPIHPGMARVMRLMSLQDDPRFRSWTRPSGLRCGAPARRDDAAGSCPRGGATPLACRSAAQSDVKRSHSSGERDRGYKIERSCGVASGFKRSTAESRMMRSMSVSTRPQNSSVTMASG